MAQKHDINDLFNFDIVGYTKPNMQMLKDNYTKIMKGKKRGCNRVVMTAPDMFLKNCYAKSDILKESIRRKGDIGKPKWALPYIDLRREKALGRGRALVCHKEGVESIPVLVVGRSESDIDAYIKLVTPKKKVVKKIAVKKDK